MTFSQHPGFSTCILAAIVLATALATTVAMLPEPPPFAVVLSAAAALWLPFALRLLRAYRPVLADAPLARYLVNAALVGLEIVVCWTVLRSRIEVVEQLEGYWFAPLLYGLLLFPVARIFTEIIARRTAAPLSLKIFHVWILAARPALLFFSIGLVGGGIFLEIHEETPAIDPTVPLAILWPISAFGVLWAVVRAAAQAAYLRRQVRPPLPPAPLDDPPPADAPKTPSSSLHTDLW